MSQNLFKFFSQSLLSIVKSGSLYSGNSVEAFNTVTEEAARALDLGRTSIWMFSDDRAIITRMDLFKRKKNEHTQGLSLQQKDFPIYFRALFEDRWINANDANNDPRTKEFSQPYFIPVGIGAVLNAPIRFAGEVIGLLSLEHVGQTRIWSEEEINYACSLADLVSNALETQKRELAEQALFKSEERYRSLIEKIPDLVYETNLESVLTFVSPSIEHIMGYTVEEAIGKNLVEIAYAVPEDKKRVLDQFLENSFIANYQLKLLKKDGSHWWGEVSASLALDAQGNPTHVNGIVRDISVQKTAQDRLSFQASHDSLTGLINRRQFELQVNELLVDTKRHSQTDLKHAMCFLDLDQFKVVNDTSGHHAGDALLQSLGGLLQTAIREQDCLARLSGDEFGLLLMNCNVEKAKQVCNNILDIVLNYQFHWQEKVFKIGVSIGLVEISKQSKDFSELFRQADAACYVAKDMGRNRIQVYHPNDTELATRQRQMGWVSRINQALDDNRFVLYAQEIMPFNASEEKHFELLIRMLDEQGEIIPPGAFLPAAERYSLMEKIDAWVFDNACRFIAEHSAALKDVTLFTINLSGPSFNNAGFLNQIMQTIKDTELSPNRICFEVTETIAVSNLETAINFIDTLKETGFQFALDDFGSGISSFGYLKTLPVDYLKIDGMFVKDIADDPIDFAMVKSINEIGHVMGMKTIAEFVENDAIKQKLIDIGVDYGQGYGLARPIPLTMLANINTP